MVEEQDGGGWRRRKELTFVFFWTSEGRQHRRGGGCDESCTVELANNRIRYFKIDAVLEPSACNSSRADSRNWIHFRCTENAQYSKSKSSFLVGLQTFAQTWFLPSGTLSTSLTLHYSTLYCV